MNLSYKFEFSSLELAPNRRKKKKRKKNSYSILDSTFQFNFTKFLDDPLSICSLLNVTFSIKYSSSEKFSNMIHTCTYFVILSLSTFFMHKNCFKIYPNKITKLNPLVYLQYTINHENIHYLN